MPCSPWLLLKQYKLPNYVYLLIICNYSPAAEGRKVEVEYVQTFNAVS